MIVARILALATALAGCGGWTLRDSVLEASFAGATAADWHQTRGIVTTCSEQNPIIGACGERVPVDAYFPIALLIHVGIAALLPPGYRTAWQTLYIGAEINQVWSNYRN